MTALLRAIAILVAAAVTGFTAQAQSTLLQGGAITPGHVPMYVNGFSQQPIVQDSGTAAAGGPGMGLSELGIAVRGTGTPPFANAGTGALGTNVCDYDAPTTNPTGYHSLCFSPNAQGGGLIAYNAFGTASPLSLTIEVNGQKFTFPGTADCTGCGTMATQNANGVAITGGSITGTAITAMNGVGLPIIIDTTGSTFIAPVAMQIGIVVNKTTPSTTTIDLPAASNYPTCPSSTESTCPVYWIKDGAGNAASFNIAIVASDGKNIDGTSTFTLVTNFQAVELVFNGTQWNVF